VSLLDDALTAACRQADRMTNGVALIHPGETRGLPRAKPD
jgi:hypothetical protein